MTKLFKSLALAGAAASTLAIAPASAQVQGNMATVNTPGVIISTNAFRTAYQQIATTYATQIETIRARGQEQQTLLQQLDTNSDGQLDEAEQRAAQGSSQMTRLGAIEQEVVGLSNQVESARVYAVEQLLTQYSPAVQQIVTAQNIQMIVTPDALVYANPAADISQQVVTALNTSTPSVQITPPQGWQPRRNSLAVYQQITQALQAAQAQAAAQQQAGQPAAAQQPTGR